MPAIVGKVDVDMFRVLAGKSSALPPKLKAALRKRIRAAAQVAAQDAKNHALLPPESQGKSGKSTGLRQEIADGIKVTLMTGNTAGVVIRETASSAAHPRSVVVGYGALKGWRHPRFGDKSEWFPQKGRVYFGPVIAKHRNQVSAAVRQAMVEAAQTLK